MGDLPDNTSTRNSSIATIAARSLLAFAQHPTPIRVELSGGRRCSAIGITATGNAPVLALCHRLIEAGHNPTLPLEAYPGTTLCLRVRSIGEGARLTVREGASNGRPRFVRLTSNMADLGGEGLLALLLPIDFDSAKTRARYFGDCPDFVAKIVLRKRIVWFPRDDGVREAPKENSAWFLWQRSLLRTPPIILYAPETEPLPKTPGAERATRQEAPRC